MSPFCPFSSRSCWVGVTRPTKDVVKKDAHTTTPSLNLMFPWMINEMGKLTKVRFWRDRDVLTPTCPHAHRHTHQTVPCWSRLKFFSHFKTISCGKATQNHSGQLFIFQKMPRGFCSYQLLKSLSKGTVRKIQKQFSSANTYFLWILNAALYDYNSRSPKMLVFLPLKAKMVRNPSHLLGYGSVF